MVVCWYGSGGEVLQETDLAGTLKREFVYFNGKRTARRDAPSGNVHYYFSDHLGSSNVVTNATGVIEEESDFYPFGGERSLVSTSGNSYKFTGKERDPETNLDYFGVRYYAFNFGRFISVDRGPLLAANPQSLNRYSYAFNNPHAYIDPDGNLATRIHYDLTIGILAELGYSRDVATSIAFHDARVDDLYNDKAHAHMHSQDGADAPNPAAARSKSLSFIKQSRIAGAEDVLSGNFARAREYLGQLLHTAQDEKHDYQPFDKHKGTASDVLNPDGRKQAASDILPSKEQIQDAKRRTQQEVRRFENQVITIGRQQGMSEIQVELQLHLFRISEGSKN